MQKIMFTEVERASYIMALNDRLIKLSNQVDMTNKTTEVAEAKTITASLQNEIEVLKVMLLKAS